MSDPKFPAGPVGEQSNGRVIAVVVAGLVVIGGLIGLLLVNGGDDGETGSGELDTTAGAQPTTSTSPAPASTGAPESTRPSTSEGPLAAGADTDELARAAVLLLQLDAQGEPACFSGSGSVVSADGRILTNAHVVWNDPVCPYERLGVAIVEETDRPPVLTYLADVVAHDDFLDLAVVQITADVEGAPVSDLSLPHVALGDSETVDLGDPIRILGFPGIGGDTITFTRGAVSGFVAERGVVDDRAWIKTDATIAGGNSGGMAVNESGELVGVPTTVGAGDAALTDCRVIEDTNGDGFIDDSDGCIPIGGFINGLRPANLARPLVEQAASGTILRPEAPDSSPTLDFEISGTTIDSIFFAPEVIDDEPTEIIHYLPSGRDRLCAFWTYSGLADGLSYDAIWRIDGEADPDASFLQETWVGGPSGQWWVCIVNDQGVADGLYEFEFSVEGEFLASEAVFVGGARSPASITVENRSDDIICFVQISPTGAGYWGPDELGPTEVIGPAGTRRFDRMVTGRYDLTLHDCDLEPLFEAFDLEVDGDEVIVHER